MKSLVIAFVMLLAGPVFAQDPAFGLHLTTYHSPNIDCGNGKNPGIYARASFGIVVGTYYNSCERQSEYIAYRTPEWNGLAIQVGGVTGYVEKVTPLAFPTYRFHVYDGYRAMISGASRNERTVVHLSIEKPF